MNLVVTDQRKHRGFNADHVVAWRLREDGRMTYARLSTVALILIVAFLVGCVGVEAAFPEPDGPWVAYEAEGYDPSAPPYSPSFLPPWTSYRGLWDPSESLGWDNILLGIDPVDKWTSGYCIHAIPLIGRGIVRCQGWPKSMQLRREKP